MSVEFKAGSTKLPCPTSMTVDDELIWSKNTGRVANGKMVGTVIAEKKNISLNWGVLKESEYKTIKNSLVKGFFNFTYRDDGTTLTISVYRGTLQKEAIGELGDGVYYYRSATATLIQQ